MNDSKGNISGNGQLGKALIYVVDDEPMLLELALVILQPLGYEVRTFRNPDSAIEAFAVAHPPPALIITDFSMHATNGLDLIQACRRVQPGQRILLVSGTVDERIYREAVEKPDRFLPKPYLPQDLASAVKALVARSSC
jgi:CheY-like chemotaxis protein